MAAAPIATAHTSIESVEINAEFEHRQEDEFSHGGFMLENVANGAPLGDGVPIEGIGSGIWKLKKPQFGRPSTEPLGPGLRNGGIRRGQRIHQHAVGILKRDGSDLPWRGQRCRKLVGVAGGVRIDENTAHGGHIPTPPETLITSPVM